MEQVFELPMRDGNPFGFGVLALGRVVFELPMRDGNVRPCFVSAVCLYVFELPMRDGNIGLKGFKWKYIPRFLNFL